jgi:acylpyruvate hydrolase
VRLVSYDSGQGPTAGVLLGEEIVPAAALGAPAGMRELLSGVEDLSSLDERAGRTQQRLALSDVELLAPVPDPQKIVCIGLNYRDHAAETGQEIPPAPMWFAKFANSLIGSGADIVLPAAHPDHVDYEAELALVIGRPARDLTPAQALEHVAGAMCFNDVSARDLQFQNPLWTSGKAIDTFAPCGPALVTLQEIGDLTNLGVRTRVDGELRQDGTTAQLIFGPGELIAWLSRTMTLLPGDIVATGTPAGVGVARGRFLAPGQEVEVEIDRLGTLRNRVRAE